jgi:hypothetical protein
MKGYTEQRGEHSQIVYDALLDQFLQRVLKHDFANVAEAKKSQYENDPVTELPLHKAIAVDKSLSRKSRVTFMLSDQKRRAG